MFQRVATISPLNALDYLIGSFDSDIITTDYRVRGFTRNMEGEKVVYRSFNMSPFGIILTVIHCRNTIG